MTNAKDLKTMLLSEVAHRMKAFDYDGKIRGQSTWRKTPHGHTSFHLAFTNHDTDFDVTGDVGIRFNSVEDLVNASSASMSKSVKAKTCTLGAELGNLSEGVRRRWTIVTEADVPVVADNIVAAYEAIGERFIRLLGSPEAAYEVLSKDDAESWLYSPFHGVRAMSAIALAITLGKVEDLPQLISRKENFLKARNDFGLKEFHDFVDHIRNDVSLAHNS